MSHPSNGTSIAVNSDGSWTHEGSDGGVLGEGTGGQELHAHLSQIKKGVVKATFDPTLGFGGSTVDQPPFFQVTSTDPNLDDTADDPYQEAGGERDPTKSEGYDGYETTQPLIPLPVFFSNLDDGSNDGFYLSSTDVPHGSLTNS